MKTKIFWQVILLSLAALIVLAACSAAKPTEAPAVQPSQVAATSAPAQAPQAAQSVPYPEPAQVPAYPVPGANPALGAYPAPAQPAYPVPGQAVYPPPGQNGAAQAATQVVEQMKPVSAEIIASDPAAVQLASGKVQLVEFFAFWDGTSKALAPVINGLKDTFSDRVNFVFLDIDDPANQKFKDQLGYKMQPHFFLLDKQGNIVRDWLGYIDSADLSSALEGALK
jgi:thiol-disulfide isomerase/thioredoxin